MYKHVLLPYDGSSLSDKALEEGIALAKTTGAKISLIYVLAPHHLLVGGGRSVPGLRGLEHQYYMQLEENAREMLARAQEEVVAAGLACDLLIEHGSNPHEHIAEGARRLGCDLIVMASHGRRGIAGIVIGSQTVKVLTHSTIPVLVVR